MAMQNISQPSSLENSSSKNSKFWVNSDATTYPTLHLTIGIKEGIKNLMILSIEEKSSIEESIY